MAKTTLKQVQTLQQKLSQQNIQLFKMMEMNLLQFDDKVKEELDLNPALENLELSAPENLVISLDSGFGTMNGTLTAKKQDENLLYQDYRHDNKKNFEQSNQDENEAELYIPIKDHETLLGSLNNQLSLLNLTEEQLLIGEFIIGSLDDDGYLRRTNESIADDLSFRQNFYTNLNAIEEVLEVIQDLDPPGIAARNLQECLILQLRRKKNSFAVNKALELVTNYFDDYTKKNYDRILKKLSINELEFQEVKKIIQHLNPSPGIQSDDSIGKFIIPDFFVYRNDNKLELELHTYNKPNLAINNEFVDMLKKIKAEKKKSKSEKDAQDYVSNNIQKASLFISLIKERQETMIIIMKCILDLQKDFFLTGDEANLKPMGLKDVSEITQFDISTISRVTSSKYVQTEFGIIALKFLFSEGLLNASGEEVSNRKIMKCIEELIDNEDKTKPYSDDELTRLLEKKGFKIARRTVAKYRENMKIAPKHNRKQSKINPS